MKIITKTKHMWSLRSHTIPTCARFPLIFPESAALAWWHGAYLYKEGLRSYICGFKEYHVTAPTLSLILPGQLHSIDQYMDESMEYENIIFSLSMLLPGKYDYTKGGFSYTSLNRQIHSSDGFTPVYPYYEDVVAPIDACDEICKTMPQGYQLYIKSKLYEFFFVLDNRCVIWQSH